jgi:RNA polymerase sigma factor (TIGR02999 family)
VTDAEEITQLLLEHRGGDPEAMHRLMPLVYHELRRIARRHLAGHRRGALLDTTGLVHESFLKLAENGNLPADCRAHFFALASRAMRQVAIDYARSRRALKRGGGERPVTLDERRVGETDLNVDLLALDQALKRLAKLNERLEQVVECRYFAGLTEPETAEALGISVRTVQRDWLKARAWLKRELQA